MQLTEYERFIPVLENLAHKIENLDTLDKEDKTLLALMISNQIHIQNSSAEIVTYDNVDIYEFMITQDQIKS